jgi:MFS family permease
VAVHLVSVGHLSDRTGRRPVLIAALLFELAAAALFLVWPALPGILLVRFVTGLGVGMATPTATAYLRDLHLRAWPEAGHGRFEAASTAANVGWDPLRIAVSPYDCVIRSRSQESTPLSAVLAIAVG